MNLKPVGPVQVGNNVALKIVCRCHVTSRIDFLCNNIALKIVVKNRLQTPCYMHVSIFCATVLR